MVAFWKGWCNALQSHELENELLEDELDDMLDDEVLTSGSRPLATRVSPEYLIQTLALVGAAALAQALVKVFPVIPWFVPAVLVNVALCVAVLRVGFVCGLCVTVAAPLAALSCGLYPHFSFYLLMVLGNCALVAGITLILSYARNDAWDRYTIISLIFGSAIKWFVLFLLITKFAAVRFLTPALITSQMDSINMEFGIAQLACGLVGCAIGFGIVKMLLSGRAKPL
ncbi:MAG: hypothetical protein FWD16_00700 [Clostridia bacterium]|nr:hypothetical protein [Clostridia bacterium]